MPFQLSKVTTHPPSTSWRGPSLEEGGRALRSSQTSGISAFPIGAPRLVAGSWVVCLVCEQRDLGKLKGRWQRLERAS